MSGHYTNVHYIKRCSVQSYLCASFFFFIVQGSVNENKTWGLCLSVSPKFSGRKSTGLD